VVGVATGVRLDASPDRADDPTLACRADGRDHRRRHRRIRIGASASGRPIRASPVAAMASASERRDRGPGLAAAPLGRIGAQEAVVAVARVSPAGPSRRRFSVGDFYAMAEAGVFAPGERVELIEGEIYQMAPIGPRHGYSTDVLGNEFKERLGRLVRVRVQGPLHLDDGSEPEPDLLLLRPHPDRYRGRHPTPGDVLLLVEVSDTTLDFDRSRKLPVYARADIPEVWIVNLVDGRIETHAEPSGGAYRNERAYAAGQEVAPREFPECLLSVDEILG
jgi:Uma2 family endonuclease